MQQATGTVVAGFRRVREFKLSRGYFFEVRIDSGNFMVSAAQWAYNQEVVRRIRQHNPFTSPRLYK
jgi:hypothetical protein